MHSVDPPRSRSLFMKNAVIAVLVLVLWLCGLAKAAGSGFLLFALAFFVPPAGVVMGLIFLLESLP